MKKLVTLTLSFLCWGIFNISEVQAQEIQSFDNSSYQTFVKMDERSRLKSIGIFIKASSLNNLPHDPFEIVLNIPPGKHAKPFRHIAIDWEPHGHEPGMYGVPHFDFHFYMISNAKRMTITCQGADAAICLKPIAPEYAPAGYVPGPEGVPRMGWHWVDPTSPEFNGQPFTTTLIYGFYGGRMTFIEPMVTLAYLQSHPHFSQSIKQPQEYPENGYYPMTYSVNYNHVYDRYEIVLSDMVYRK